MNRNGPIILLVCVGAVLIGGCKRAATSGRQGNELFQDGSFDEAAVAYQKGLDRFEEKVPGKLHSDLLNNQGAARYRAEDIEAAQNAFISSIAMADGRSEQVRGSYNAGNAAFAADAKQVSADFFRQALLLDPGNPDAKYNYEFVKRQLEQDQQNQQGGGEPPPKPSDYARELKAQADALVEQHRYREAHTLLTDGLKRDPTIKAYQTFIDRTASVADIDSNQPAETR